jgi:hypothetical protein
VTKVLGALVSFRSSVIFSADGAVLTSDSTLRFRQREEVVESFSLSGFEVESVRNAADRGELRPLRRHRFADARTVVAILEGAPAVDHGRLRRDPDETSPQNSCRWRLPSRQSRWRNCPPGRWRPRIMRNKRDVRIACNAPTTFDPLPFGVEAARAYGLVPAAAVERGRQPRRRFADLLIASIAVAEQLPLLTRKADNFLGLDRLISVVEV